MGLVVPVVAAVKEATLVSRSVASATTAAFLALGRGCCLWPARSRTCETKTRWPRQRFAFVLGLLGVSTAEGAVGRDKMPMLTCVMNMFAGLLSARWRMLLTTRIRTTVMPGCLLHDLGLRTPAAVSCRGHDTASSSVDGSCALASLARSTPH